MKELHRYIFVTVVALFCCLAGTSAQQKRAFLVGISDYDSEWPDISGANDIKLLTPLLKQQNFKIEKTLFNEKATYRNIISGLEQLAKSCKEGDIVYVHFSMHGQPFEDMNGDEEDGWDEALIPVDARREYQKAVYEGEKHLIDDTLEVYANMIREKLGPNGILYVAIDACHAGGSLRGGADDDVISRGVESGFSPSGKEYNPQKKSSNYVIRKKVPGLSRVVYIEACKSDERNYEITDPVSKNNYGSLSYCIYQTIKTHKIDKTTGWLDEVMKAMGELKVSNKYLLYQHIVIEKTAN